MKNQKNPHGISMSILPADEKRRNDSTTKIVEKREKEEEEEPGKVARQEKWPDRKSGEIDKKGE